MNNKKRKSCFFVTPIGPAGSEQRERADNLLKFVLRPVLSDTLEIVRADEVEEPGTITTDIVRRLHQDNLVIADLTGQNPNVMYEIGLRHCFNLPIVHLSQEGEKPPFDLAAERIIFFDINNLASVEEAKNKIQSACRIALDAKPFKSPVVRALEAESLLATMTNVPKSASVLEKLNSINDNIARVSDNLESIYDLIGEIPAHVDFYSPEVDTSRLEEFLRVFDRIGPSEMMHLAKAAKLLVEKSK